VQIAKAFTFPFEDSRWLPKSLIGWLVSLVPILNFAWYGYAINVLKNVEAGQERPLPEWDDFGAKFVAGLWIFLASLIFALPVMLLACFYTVPVLFASNSDNQSVLNALGAAGIAVSCIIIVYALLLSFLYPAVFINFSRKGTFGSCFEFKEIFRIMTANIGKYLAAWGMTLVWGIAIFAIASLISTVLLVIPCIGWVVAWVISGIASIWSTLVGAHLFGQVAMADRMTI
jgi:hypothetical protein